MNNDLDFKSPDFLLKGRFLASLRAAASRFSFQAPNFSYRRQRNASAPYSKLLNLFMGY